MKLRVSKGVTPLSPSADSFPMQSRRQCALAATVAFVWPTRGNLTHLHLALARHCQACWQFTDLQQ